MNRFFSTHLFATLTIAGLVAISSSSLTAADKAPKPAVNIGSVVNKSSVRLNTATFVDRLGTALNNTRKFKMIESDRIGDIVAEWNKSAAGMTTEQKADPAMQAPGYKIVATIAAFEIKTAKASMGGAAFRQVTARLALNVRMLRLDDGVVVVDKEIVGESTQRDSATANSSNTASGDMFYQNCVKDASQKVVNEMMELCYPITILDYDEEEGEMQIRIQKERAEQAVNDPATAGHFKVFKVKGRGEDRVEKELAIIRITSIDSPKQSTCTIVSFKGKKKKITPKECICRPTKKPKIAAPKTGFDDL